ncbi:hypothetical protein HHK36_000243 [Tetracentron sinense]|uniref:KIB1-4 beta-propeller domain-containing protein n=1 Tax=Tetracentron sinense TaxID=13715 RepID=A0A835A198_TETSI|nr:hypothetical protein HHK36_000243 [Tetracentron sinense]
MIHERTLPEARGKQCWCSQGWLITFSIDLNISLLNPLTRLQIQLLPHRTFKNHYDTLEEDEEFGYTLTELQEMYIHKAIVSSSPSSTLDYVVMVIHGPNSQLAFARPGDEKKLARLDHPFDLNENLLATLGLGLLRIRGRLPFEALLGRLTKRHGKATASYDDMCGVGISIVQYVFDFELAEAVPGKDLVDAVLGSLDDSNLQYLSCGFFRDTYNTTRTGAENAAVTIASSAISNFTFYLCHEISLHPLNFFHGLMLAEKKNSNTRAFFNLSKVMVHEHMLPKAHGKRCWGSQGWLITFSIDLNISLLNPLTRVQIQLPPHRTFKDHYKICEDDEECNYTPAEMQKVYICKAIVSSSPSSTSPSDYVVMVIHGPKIQLAFARPGDDAWTAIEETPKCILMLPITEGNSTLSTLEEEEKLLFVMLKDPILQSRHSLQWPRRNCC